LGIEPDIPLLLKIGQIIGTDSLPLGSFAYYEGFLTKSELRRIEIILDMEMKHFWFGRKDQLALISQTDVME
jgi:hypothetical protein